jgi:hypothetical protein
VERTTNASSRTASTCTPTRCSSSTHSDDTTCPT